MFERRLAVEAISFLSERYFVLAFRSPEIAAAARPGQFLMISATETVEPLLRRPMAFYEILREAGDPVGFTILVEVTGRGTYLMSRLRPGDGARVLGPLGRPFDLEGPADAEHLLVMGGVGAAPFPLVAERLVRRGARVRAFIGGRTSGHLLCRADFERLEVPVSLSTDDGSSGHHGLVTEVLTAHMDRHSPSARLYSCGPTPMMRAVDEIARARGLRHQVSLEAPMACGIGVCLSCVVRVGTTDHWSYQRVCREGPVFDAAELVWA